MANFVADFETTTRLDDCRVWAYAICEVKNPENIEMGTTIDDFMAWCSSRKERDVIYFHNLKFDSQFIMTWLFNNGYKHVTDVRDKKSKTFTTVISDKGLFYEVDVIFEKKGRKINKVKFLDSLKLIPLSVDAIAKALKLPISKLKIDYSAHDNLPIGAELSEEEKEYIKHDVQIVAYAIDYFHNEGLTKMTIGACALSEYKKIIHNKNFQRYFPTPKYHNDVKQSYRGGFTYLNPKYANKVIKDGIVLDVNSLYPSVMYNEYLPFGIPIFFKGKYEPDSLYPLYTQMIRCQFTLKKGKIPTIQIKNNFLFRSNEYLTESGDTEVVLCLNSVDMELFLKHYDVYNIEYMSGWKFKSTRGLFNEYIDKWSNNKIKAKKEGNNGLYLISKLFLLNSLYGKFGTDTSAKKKIPYMDLDGIIHYRDGEIEEREGVYVAMASFVTSYARLKTVSSAQKIMDNKRRKISRVDFVYADTDSLHLVLNGEDEKEFLKNSGLDVDDYKLGAWKWESKFNKGKFLRQKCYMENSTEDIENPNPEYELKITVAGMPKDCYPYVTFDNFKIGASYKGKKQPKMVKGGVVLTEIDFTIKKV